MPEWKEMVRQLVRGHESCVRTAREAFPSVEQANDQPTCDVLTQRMQAHEKNGVDAAQPIVLTHCGFRMDSNPDHCRKVANKQLAAFVLNAVTPNTGSLAEETEEVAFPR